MSWKWIGKETARQLVNAGCKVVLACRSKQRAAATAYEMRETTIINGRPMLGVAEQLTGGMGVDPMVLDLSSPASIQQCERHHPLSSLAPGPQ